MRLTILYRNDAERSALSSVFGKVENVRLKYIYFGNSKSVDEYRMKYFYPVAVLLKAFEVFWLFVKLLPYKNIAFSTPHPSFRVLRFIKPGVKLLFYIRTLHIIEDTQSLSDRLSVRSKKLSKSLLFLNNYFADYYYSPGIINNSFLYFKGVDDSKIVNVGLHPINTIENIPNRKRRIVIASQAWDAHGFFETYTGEVEFISHLANELSLKFPDLFEIIIKLHPREREGVYSDVNAKVCRALDTPLTTDDILLGGLSSYLTEQYLTGVKVVFFVHEKATDYYDKPVKKFEIPVYHSIPELVNVVDRIIQLEHSMEKELVFLKKAAMPPIYINQI